MHRLTRTDTPTDDKQRFGIGQLLEQINYLGNAYPVGLQQSLLGRNTEDPNSGFASVTRSAYQNAGPVFSCILARGLLFSEARFLWQQLRDGRPGDLFSTQELRILERPWPNATTGELLWRAEQDVSLAGNFYLRLYRGRLWRLRPDWMHIVLGSESDPADASAAIDAEVIGYRWGAPGERKITLMPNEVAHWSPIPDPLASYRGMSWVTPVLRDVTADNQATIHKQAFYENGATPNLVIMPDATVDYSEFKQFQDDFRDQHEGAWNAYKTLFLGGGSSIEVVGANMKDAEFKAIQGAGETRIAAAAGVPPIIAGFSEGLSSATYSNYSMARRKFGDHWARPQWRSFCAAIQPLLTTPGAARLWYDDRDIAFLREDSADEADIKQTMASTIMTLINAGYEPDAVIRAVTTGNMALLTGAHTGLTSVQLTPPDDGSTPLDQG